MFDLFFDIKNTSDWTKMLKAITAILTKRLKKAGITDLAANWMSVVNFNFIFQFYKLVGLELVRKDTIVDFMFDMIKGIPWNLRLKFVYV